MSAYKMLNWRDRAASSVEQTVAAFLEIGEAIATRWIQTANGVLLLQMVPDNGASGAIYVFDRQREQWYISVTHKSFCPERSGSKSPLIQRLALAFAASNFFFFFFFSAAGFASGISAVGTKFTIVVRIARASASIDRPFVAARTRRLCLTLSSRSRIIIVAMGLLYRTNC
jgi:hypothetical protein